MSILVYISGEFDGKEAWLDAVSNAINKVNMVPRTKDFPICANDPVSARMESVKKCDLLIGIVAHRYGWIPKGKGISITEMEYDAAKDKLMFLYKSKVVDLDKDLDEGKDKWTKQIKLDRFKKKIQDESPQIEFTTDLASKVEQALTNWKERRDEEHSGGDDYEDDYEVYIGAYSETMEVVRNKLCKTLESQEYRVFQGEYIEQKRKYSYGIPPPWKSEEYHKAAEKVMASVPIVVHLLDDDEGPKIEGAPSNSYLRQQVELGRELGKSPTIWIPKSLIFRDIQDKNYKEFLEGLEARKDKLDHFFVRGIEANLSSEIGDILNQMRGHNSVKSAALLEYREDETQKAAEGLQEALKQQQITADVIGRYNGGAFAEILREYSAYVMICKTYNQVTSGRLQQIVKEAMRLSDLKRGIFSYFESPQSVSVRGVTLLYKNQLEPLIRYFNSEPSCGFPG